MNIKNYKLIKANKNEMSEVIQFLNYCFNINFKNVVGKLYKDGIDYSNIHYIIKNNNTIIAAICINKSEWFLNKNKLKVAGIGSVCVHPEYRNKGIMQYMLNQSNKIIKNYKSDISILSGNYNRYNHFGYELANQCINYEIPFNIKHIDNNYKFVPINNLSKSQTNYLFKLNKKQPQHVKRLSSTFIDACKQWNHTSYGILKNNNLIGYIINEQNVIEEFKLENYEEIINVLYNFMYYLNTKKINVLIPCIEYTQIDKLKNFNHTLFDKGSQMCQIINFKKVIKILLTYKNKYKKLENGTLTINVENYGGIKINVNNTIAISKYTSSNYDLTLSKLDALKLLLNHNTKLDIAENKKTICNSWFPLDIYLHTADLI